MICEYGFRKAVKEDLPFVLNLYRGAIGTPGCVWDEEYPNEETLKEDFEGENLYVFLDGETVIGAVSRLPDTDLDGRADWKTTKGHIEIARVVISRAYAGKSLAVKMLESLFDCLRKQGVTAVHLAAAVCNPAAVKTYKKLGFEFLKEAFVYGHEYYLCEKQL